MSRIGPGYLDADLSNRSVAADPFLRQGPDEEEEEDEEEDSGKDDDDDGDEDDEDGYSESACSPICVSGDLRWSVVQMR